MPLILEKFVTQSQSWPKSGRVILAQSDADSVIVYQAYCPVIGHAAIQSGRFGGGGFSMSRMTWIKPNSLWMMFRSGWGTKPNQEVTLAIRLKRSAFEEILGQAVHSTFVPEVYGSAEAWQSALRTSDVRLQWDPDHGPSGNPLDRRAIQLGIRGAVLKRFVHDSILQIEDISPLVEQQRTFVLSGRIDQLDVPRETVYATSDTKVADRLGIDVRE